MSAARCSCGLCPDSPSLCLYTGLSPSTCDCPTHDPARYEAVPLVDLIEQVRRDLALERLRRDVFGPDSVTS